MPVVTLCKELLHKVKDDEKRNLVTYILMQILASEEKVKQRYP